MKFKKDTIENGTRISEWEFNLTGFTLAIAKLIQVLHDAGII
ncbi:MULTISPECIES: hypothetical protein [Bacillus cereus group]|nr:MULTISPECIES: hypothetical protein [Bacillus cereus group]MED2037237.1 hypothetical protein [Bacillus wiedmannii]